MVAVSLVRDINDLEVESKKKIKDYLASQGIHYEEGGQADE